MYKENQKCPLCGSCDIYIGATAIECGHIPECINWTQKQADEVEILIKKKEEASKVLIRDLGWDASEEITPPWSFGAYGDDGDDFSD